ncbi:hypothetical protein D3C85_865020 [compost metagenome]
MEEQSADQHPHQRRRGIENRRVTGGQHLGGDGIEGRGNPGVDHPQQHHRLEFAFEVPADAHQAQDHQQPGGRNRHAEKSRGHRANHGGDDAHEQETRPPNGGKCQQTQSIDEVHSGFLP